MPFCPQLCAGDGHNYAHVVCPTCFCACRSGPAAYSSQQVVKPGTTMGVLYERGQTSAYESLYLALVPVALVVA